MGFIRILLIVIEVVVCLLLIGVILLQKSRDSGLGMAFGAGMGESLFGAQAGNVLTRITIILGAIFLVNTTLLAIIQPAQESSLVDRMLPGGATAPEQAPMTAQPQDAGVDETGPLMPYDFPDDLIDAVESEVRDLPYPPTEEPVADSLPDPIPAPIDDDPLMEWDDPPLMDR